MTDPVQALFDREAERYDAWHDAKGVEGHALRARLDAVARLLGDGPGDVLDAGMGPGRLLEQLARRSWTVSGIDLSPRMVELARARLREAGGRLTQASVQAIPLADSSFDAIVATGVLEYVDDPRAALGELNRLLRPGGRLLLSIPNPLALHVVSKRVYYPAVRLARRFAPSRRPPPGPKRFRGLGTLEALLVEQGLIIEAVEYTSYAVVPVPLDRLLRSVAARAAERLESRRARPRPLLGTQIVFAARKP